jgi:hypothetical protein
MPRTSRLVVLGAVAWPITAQPMPADLKPVPAAQQLFERDWVLMNWALKFYDRDHDIMLEPEEARQAADGFRKIADSNRDGRVTSEEYRAARNFILTH